MKRLTTIACVVAASLSFGVGMAADTNGDDHGTDNGHADALERVPVVVDVRTCLALTEVTGGRGVAPADGAAYTPGVDARGKPVVPAEGPGGAPDWSTLGQPLVIDLSVDIAERYGVNVPAGSSLPLGTLLVRDGRVWFNGHPVAGRDREALWEACRRLGAVQGQAERGKPGGR